MRHLIFLIAILIVGAGHLFAQGTLPTVQNSSIAIKPGLDTSDRFSFQPWVRLDTLTGALHLWDDGQWVQLAKVSDLDTITNSGGPTTLPWDSLTSVPAGFSDGIDDVDDADNSVSNEIQVLSLNGSDLTLSNGGGTIALPAAGGSPGSAGDSITTEQQRWVFEGIVDEDAGFSPADMSIVTRGDSVWQLYGLNLDYGHTDTTGLIAMRRSYDAGLTWTTVDTVINTPNVDDRNPHIGFHGNVLWLWLSRMHPRPDGTPNGWRDNGFMYSLDYGNTWSTYTVFDTEVSYPVTDPKKVPSPGKGLTNRDSSYAFFYRQSELIARATADGQTWHPSFTVASSTETINEFSVVRLGQDTFLHTVRQTTGVGGLYQSHTYDAGATWTALQRTNAISDANPGKLLWDSVANQVLLVTAFRGGEQEGVYVYTASKEEVLSGPTNWRLLNRFYKQTYGDETIYGYATPFKRADGKYAVKYIEREGGRYGRARRYKTFFIYRNSGNYRTQPNPELLFSRPLFFVKNQYTGNSDYLSIRPVLQPFENNTNYHEYGRGLSIHSGDGPDSPLRVGSSELAIGFEISKTGHLNVFRPTFNTDLWDGDFTLGNGFNFKTSGLVGAGSFPYLYENGATKEWRIFNPSGIGSASYLKYDITEGWTNVAIFPIPLGDNTKVSGVLSPSNGGLTPGTFNNGIPKWSTSGGGSVNWMRGLHVGDTGVSIGHNATTVPGLNSNIKVRILSDDPQDTSIRLEDRIGGIYDIMVQNGQDHLILSGNGSVVVGNDQNLTSANYNPRTAFTVGATSAGEPNFTFHARGALGPGSFMNGLTFASNDPDNSQPESCIDIIATATSSHDGTRGDASLDFLFESDFADPKTSALLLDENLARFNGDVNTLSGFQVAGLAPLNQVLLGNGTRAVFGNVTGGIVSLTDTGGFYTVDVLENALQELGPLLTAGNGGVYVGSGTVPNNTQAQTSGGSGISWGAIDDMSLYAVDDLLLTATGGDVIQDGGLILSDFAAATGETSRLIIDDSGRVSTADDTGDLFHGVGAISGDSGDGQTLAVTYPSTLVSSANDIQVTVKATGSGTPSGLELVAYITTESTTGFTISLLEQLEAGESVNVSWAVFY